MLPHRHLASLSQMRAKLRPLVKPQVWGTLAVVSGLGFGTWAYFNHPEWLALTENQQTVGPTNTASETQSDISEEDKAIGADIDNISVLQKELSGVESTQLDANEETNKQENLFDEFINKRESAQNNLSVSSEKSTAEIEVPNPLAIKAAEPFGKGSIFPSGNSIGPQSNIPSTETSEKDPSSSNLPTSVSGNSTASGVSPLQSAIDRSNKTDNSSATENSDRTTSPLKSALDRNLGENSTPSQNTNQLKQQDSTSNLSPNTIPGQTTIPVSPNAGSNGYSTFPQSTYPSSSTVPGTTGYNTPTDTNNNPPNSYTYLTQPQTVPTAPVPAQANPSLTPTTPSNLGQSPFQNSISGNGYNNPGYNSNFSNPGLPASQVQQPSNFSVPRPVPGRYIGGGQINTFSNP